MLKIGAISIPIITALNLPFVTHTLENMKLNKLNKHEKLDKQRKLSKGEASSVLDSLKIAFSTILVFRVFQFSDSG